MATQYAPIAKDSSINTTEQTPRNIADVLAEELSAIEQAIAGGSGSGGHVIEDTNGTALTQRADLQFVGVYTEDDSANDRTKVNVVRTMTKAQMDALSSAEKVGFIRTSDEADNPYQSEQIHAAQVSGSISATFADSTAIGGYRSTQAQRVPMSSLTGYPTGKTIVGYSLYCKNSSAEYYAGVLINHNAALILNCSDPNHSYDIYGTIYYKE